MTFIAFGAEDSSLPRMAKTPTKDDYIRYFHYLHHNQQYKSSSLWLTYSRWNNCHQRFFGTKLQITVLLKNYQSGYVRKIASIVTLGQVHQALLINDKSPSWVLEKCVISFLCAVDDDALSCDPSHLAALVWTLRVSGYRIAKQS